MDHESFDRLTRALGAIGTRRGALGALLGTGLARALGVAEAAKKDRNKKRRRGKKGRRSAQVSAQAADCSSPGPSSNMNGCNFAGEDFSGQDLSGSSMVGTIFRNAELVGTNLSSSNMRGANFRGADLCGADLSSSVLRNADFRGFNPANGGRVTNLTLADLSSSGGCGTILTNQFTVICGTIWCDGSVRNDDCPGVDPEDLCCTTAQCGAGQACVDAQCVPCTGLNQACASDLECCPFAGTPTACCPDGCKAVDRDAQNCGECGNVCPNGEGCNDRACCRRIFTTCTTTPGSTPCCGRDRGVTCKPQTSGGNVCCGVEIHACPSPCTAGQPCEACCSGQCGAIGNCTALPQ